MIKFFRNGVKGGRGEINLGKYVKLVSLGKYDGILVILGGIGI